MEGGIFSDVCKFRRKKLFAKHEIFMCMSSSSSKETIDGVWRSIDAQMRKTFVINSKANSPEPQRLLKEDIPSRGNPLTTE